MICGECRQTREIEHIQEQLRDADRRLDGHDQRLEQSAVSYAVINTKLNILLAVLSAVGVAVFGAVVRMVAG
jgi:Mg2+ and Co2+ transporter CorA